MSNIKIVNSSFETELELALVPGIRAGFPSPAADYTRDNIDFNRDFIRHPEATFYARVSGDSMIDAGICDGDLAVVDRAVEPENGDIVVAFINGEFTMKYLDTTHRDEGYIQLRPANAAYHPIKVENVDRFEVWGVVVWTIKNWKK